jgi:hypothetical protein
MKSATHPTAPSVAAWDHVIQLDQSMTLTAARALLKLKFTATDKERMQTLSMKARQGQLSESESLEIATFEQLGCLLDILHSKARRKLKPGSAKAG